MLITFLKKIWPVDATVAKPPDRQPQLARRNYMPNVRSQDKDKISCWVQDKKVLDEYCKKNGMTQTEVIQQLINDLKKKRKWATDNE